MTRAAIFTMDKIQIVEDGNIVDGELEVDDLILITSGDTRINLGNVRGKPGPAGADGSNVLPTDSGIANAINNPDSQTLAALKNAGLGGSSANNKPMRRAFYPAAHCNGMLTLGLAASYSVRRVFELPFNVDTFRIIVRNYDFLHDVAATGSLKQFELYIGKHRILSNETMSGEFESAPFKAIASRNIVGSEIVKSDWIRPDQFAIKANEQFMLSYGFTGNSADAQVSYGPGSGWWVSPMDASKHAQLPSFGSYDPMDNLLDISIEYTVKTEAPTILVIGNAHSESGNTSGYATRGEMTSWPHKMMMKTGAPVSSLSSSSVTLANFNAASPKWNFYSNVDYVPDVVILAELNAMDLINGVSIAANKTNMATTITKIRQLWPSTRIFATAMLPRSDINSTIAVAMRQWDQFMNTLPYGIEQFLDASRVLRSPELSRRGLYPKTPTADPDRPTVTLGVKGVGGTFTAGTRNVRIEAVNANGATAGSVALPFTLTANQTQQYLWNEFIGSPDVMFYRIWRDEDNSGNTTTKVAEVPKGTHSYTDTGSSLGTGSGPGSANTTWDIPRLAPEFIAGTDDIRFNERGHEAIADSYSPSVKLNTGQAMDAKAWAVAVNNYIAWLTMDTSLPDFSGGYRRFKRTLTSDETLNVPLGTDGQMFLIRYIASGANRNVTMGANMAFPAEFTSIPPIVNNTSLLLSFIFSANRNKWVCVSFASGV